jgi:hypothetical protein
MKPDTKIMELAGAIALEAPLKRPRFEAEAKIPWNLIIKLRKRLCALGGGWEFMWPDIRKPKRRRTRPTADRAKEETT